MNNGRTRVYFTIDTETSMGGAWHNPAWAPLPPDLTVFGKCGSGLYGIPLIMSILEERGFRGTFFTEVFCAYNVGYEPVAEVLRLIRSRGHDAQLHLHPEQRFYRDYVRGGPRREEGLMFAFPPSEQRALVGEGVSLFRELGGQTPRAYRAGCYGASETTLSALPEHGIEIDSSYNCAYLGSTCGFRNPFLNAPVKIAGVHEFPVTVFRVAGLSGYKPLEISAVSVAEIVDTIRRVREAGCRDVVLVLHSFSLLKNRGIRYQGCRPDDLVIRRFRRLVKQLADMRGEIEVSVLGEVDLAEVAAPQPQPIPSLGWFTPSVRKLGQGINRLSWV